MKEKIVWKLSRDFIVLKHYRPFHLTNLHTFSDQNFYMTDSRSIKTGKLHDRHFPYPPCNVWLLKIEVSAGPVADQ